ncbi:MAG: hypothetical protein AB7V13_21985 [Pseudorhodoplanes sp.]|uniref:hypothetical protein n=1 Tax=Pseudorhodoplanes sp. TaxID=1934341 RepID=UPI003D0BB114
MPAKGQDTMQTSLYLAKLIGPTLIVIGLGMLINRDGYRDMAREFLGSRALIYLAGLFAFIPGLAMVLAHNIWVADWRVVITLLGWLAVIGGAFRILFPQEVTRIGTRMIANPNTMLIGGIAVLILGAILSFYGYAR